MRWRDCIEFAADAGYDEVHVDLDSLAASGDPDPRRTLDRHRIAASTATLPVEFRRDATTFENDLARWPELAMLAQQAGIRTVTRSLPPASDMPAGRLRDTLRERIRRCASVAAANGIRLALEGIGPVRSRSDHPHPFIWRLTDVQRFASECGPNVGVVLDAWHWYAAGDTVTDLRDVVASAYAVHVADAPPGPRRDLDDRVRAVPGEGVIDLISWVRTIRQAGWDGPLLPEVLNDEAALREPAGARARRVRRAVERLAA